MGLVGRWPTDHCLESQVHLQCLQFACLCAPAASHLPTPPARCTSLAASWPRGETTGSSCFAREGYAATEPLDVPPEPSPFDWLVRGAQAKLAALQTAVAAGDVRQLAAVLLPLLLVCLFALVLMLASLASKKTKKD